GAASLGSVAGDFGRVSNALTPNHINPDLSARLQQYKGWKSENDINQINSQRFKLFDDPSRVESGFKQYAWSKEWPPHLGFQDGVSSPYVLEPGTLIDRYGSPFGTFASPEGTPYYARALKPGSDLKPYN